MADRIVGTRGVLSGHVAAAALPAPGHSRHAHAHARPRASKAAKTAGARKAKAR
jgi:hypothetical protein